jgi:C4-dicarboxylate-binding protein DctP
MRVPGVTVCIRRGAWPAAGVLAPMLALLWLATAPPGSAQPQPTTLRFSLPIAPDSPTGENVREFARQIEARTGGAVKIELLGKDRRHEEHEVVAAVTSGAAEIGATALGQFANDVPLTKAFLQPFLFNFDALVEAATNPESEIRLLIEKEILHWTNARVLWWQPYGSSVIFSKQILASDPTAIAARSIGATDDQTGELIRACGGAVRRLALSDVVAGLKQGSIDAAAADIMNVKERELWRVADTITNLRYAPSLFMVVINDKAWQKLTAEQREIFAELAQDAQSYMWARFATVRAAAYAFAAEKGMRIKELSKGDVEAWRACSAPLLEAYIERAGSPGRKLFNAYGKLRASPCCREPPEAGDPTRP